MCFVSTKTASATLEVPAEGIVFQGTQPNLCLSISRQERGYSPGTLQIMQLLSPTNAVRIPNKRPAQYLIRRVSRRGLHERENKEKYGVLHVRGEG
jgi:hypothetical protein